MVACRSYLEPYVAAYGCSPHYCKLWNTCCMRVNLPRFLCLWETWRRSISNISRCCRQKTKQQQTDTCLPIFYLKSHLLSTAVTVYLGSTINANPFIFAQILTCLLYVSVSGWLHWIELHTGPWRVQPSLERGSPLESFQWRVLCDAKPLHRGPHARSWKPAASWRTSCDTIPDHIKKIIILH